MRWKISLFSRIKRQVKWYNFPATTLLSLKRSAKYAENEAKREMAFLSFLTGLIRDNEMMPLAKLWDSQQYSYRLRFVISKPTVLPYPNLGGWRGVQFYSSSHFNNFKAMNVNEIFKSTNSRCISGSFHYFLDKIAHLLWDLQFSKLVCNI